MKELNEKGIPKVIWNDKTFLDNYVDNYKGILRVILYRLDCNDWLG